jgi:hypothetical protein
MSRNTIVTTKQEDRPQDSFRKGLCSPQELISQPGMTHRPWQLDHLYNPGLSKEDLKRAREHERDRRRRKKARKATASKAEEDGSTE